MPKPSSDRARALRMAARITCAVSLLAAGAAHARERPPSSDERVEDGSSAERVADVLRLRGQGGGCVPSWGPPAPPELGHDLLSRLAAEPAEVVS